MNKSTSKKIIIIISYTIIVSFVCLHLMINVYQHSIVTNILKQKISSSLRGKEINIEPKTKADVLLFLHLNLVDIHEYVDITYDCKHFTIDLVVDATLQGFKVGVVSIGFNDSIVGHIIAVFETTDEGIIYVEPQSDNILDLKLNELCPQQEIYGNVNYISDPVWST